MLSRLFLIAALLSLTALSACSAFEEEVDVHIAVQGDAFALDAETGVYTIPFVVQNRGMAVYVPRCDFSISVSVERWEDDEWGNASAAICQAVYNMAALRLETGQEQSDARGVYGVPGLYRLQLAIAKNLDGSFDAIATSEPFVIQ